MKKIITMLLVLVLVCSACGAAAESVGDNLMVTNLYSAQGLLMTISDGSVSYSDRFNGNGAIAAISDGNKSTHVDVYGAMDSSWVHPAYVGVLLTLDGEHFIDSIAITSGLKNYPDTYRIYASTKLDGLYSSSNIVAENIVCENSTETVDISGTYKYIAIFCTKFVGNQRIKELEIFGKASDVILPDVPSDEDYEDGLSTKGNVLYLGKTPVALRGVNIPQFSWSAHGDGSSEKALYQAINEWKCSIVRLAVDPGVYVHGGVGPGNGQTVSKTAAEFQAIIDQYVTTLTNKGIAVVLDCHAYSGAYDTVVSFWDIAAPKYDDNDLVMYGLVNEPISDWRVWYEGGTVNLPHGGSKSSIGLPALLDRVRKHSDNVVVIGGIDWAFDLSGISSSGLASLASQRAGSLGMSQAKYIERYSLLSGARKGRGIVLDTHIYSHKSMNWDAALGAAAKEYPVLVGEYNPYFRNGVLSSLNEQEKAFLQKIFRWITENGFSSTSWSLGAEPFLTDHAGNITAIGVVVKEFVKTGEWDCSQKENLLYQHYKSVTAISQSSSGGAVSKNNMFINQAHLDGSAVGKDITTKLIDGETATHYDIYPWDGNLIGLYYELDAVYACNEIRMTSGISGYPDKYKIYASDNLNTLYNAENLVENLKISHIGTVTYEIDRPVKYVAFLADGYVRIKEFSVSGAKFGDMNADYLLDSRDVSLLRKQLIGEKTKTSARGDANQDKTIDIRDLIHLKKETVK